MLGIYDVMADNNDVLMDKKRKSNVYCINGGDCAQQEAYILVARFLVCASRSCSCYHFDVSQTFLSCVPGYLVYVSKLPKISLWVQ